jgi:hypothetical protein
MSLCGFVNEELGDGKGEDSKSQCYTKTFVSSVSTAFLTVDVYLIKPDGNHK